MKPTHAIVELMEHSRIAGMISEESIAGTNMLRVDVPDVDDTPGFTKYYGSSAIYAITPTDEQTCLHAVRHFRARPVAAWIIPEAPALDSGYQDDPEDVQEYLDCWEREEQDYYDEGDDA